MVSLNNYSSSESCSNISQYGSADPGSIASAGFSDRLHIPPKAPLQLCLDFTASIAGNSSYVYIHHLLMTGGATIIDKAQPGADDKGSQSAWKQRQT